MSQELERKFVSLSAFKSLDEGDGGYEGYGNDTGVLDSYDDITLPGCYADLAEFIEAGWSAPDHEWGVKDEIGIITDAHEDDRGLFVRTEFHSTDDAQQVRAKVQKRLSKGKKVGLSIGYVALEWRYVSGREAVQYLKNPTDETVARLQRTARVRLLIKIKVYEVSVVSVGANPASGVTAVKSMSTKSEKPAGLNVKGIFEERLEQCTNSLYNLFNILCYVIWEIEYAARRAVEAGSEFDAASLIDEALAEFSARVRASTLASLDDDEESSIYDYLGFAECETKSSKTSSAATGGPPARLPFPAHSETVLAAVKGLAERARSIHQLRTKEGRQLSAANRERMGQARDGIHGCLDSMKAVHDDLDELLKATEPAEKSAGPARVQGLRLKFLKLEARLRGVAVSGE